MKIKVENLKDKITLLKESKYIYHLPKDDTKKMLVMGNLRAVPQNIEILTKNPLECVINENINTWYPIINLEIEIRDYLNEYALSINGSEEFVLSNRSVGKVEIGSEQYIELVSITSEWIKNERDKQLKSK